MTAWISGVTGLSAGVFWYAAAVVFAAALVRGYSGFGLSALVVTGLSLVLEPAAAVPLVLLLEVAASIHLFGPMRRDVDWSLMRWLGVPAALAMPAGTWFLASLPAAPMRAVISAVVLVLALAIWRMPGPRFAATGPTMVPTGIVSGALNGAAAVGGLPLVLYFLGSGTAPATARAMTVVYLLFAGLYASGAAALHGLVTVRTLGLAALMLPPLIAGNALGHRHFVRSGPMSFRRFALILLIALSLAGLVRAGM